MSDLMRAPQDTEEGFFRALAAYLPNQVAYNGDCAAASAHLKALGLELPNRHWDLDLPQALSEQLDRLLQDFGGARGDWPPADLGPQLSGIITEGPHGPRLVQWDPAEQFSPYRLQVIRRLTGLVEWGFDVGRHQEYCNSREGFGQFWAALKLPRAILDGKPKVTSPAQLAAILSRSRGRLPNTGHIRAVPGFRFMGGRIAQRAYYDALIDCHHLAAGWREAGFRPVLRVSAPDMAALSQLSSDQPASALQALLEEVNSL